MGNSSSKAAGQSLRNAAQTPARKYPSRIPQNTGFVGNNISEPAGRDVPTAETKRAHQDRDAPPQASPPSPSQMPQHREQASSFRSPGRCFTRPGPLFFNVRDLHGGYVSTWLSLRSAYWLARKILVQRSLQRSEQRHPQAPLRLLVLYADA